MADQIGREFMLDTRYGNFPPSDQQQDMRPPPVALPHNDDARRIDLPPPEHLGLDPLDFHMLVTRRTSLRRYVTTPLSLAELSFLLWCTQGVKKRGELHTLRTVPSAGARHAFETALLVNRVDGLEPGLYDYAPLEHELVHRRSSPDLGDRLAQACFGQAFVKNSAVTCIWVAVPYRMTWRYSDRGYRYLHLDAGHVCQNLYLAAEAVGGGACAVAAFDDQAMASFLDLEGEEAFVIYLAAVGKRPR